MPALMDRDRLRSVFHRIGRALAGPATLCVIGSVPGILLGQPSRQTQDIDVFEQESVYDEAELRGACRGAGLEMYVDDEKRSPEWRSYIEVIEPIAIRMVNPASLT